MSLMAELGVDAPPPAKKPAPNLPVSSISNIYRVTEHGEIPLVNIMIDFCLVFSYYAQ